MMEKEGLSVDDILKGLKKITAADVKQVMQQSGSKSLPEKKEAWQGRGTEKSESAS